MIRPIKHPNVPPGVQPPISGIHIQAIVFVIILPCEHLSEPPCRRPTRETMHIDNGGLVRVKITAVPVARRRRRGCIVLPFGGGERGEASPFGLEGAGGGGVGGA